MRLVNEVCGPFVYVLYATQRNATQLCLTAAVAAASHGIGVLYLDTANGCSVRRMQQIARARYADANGVSEGGHSGRGRLGAKKSSSSRK